MRKFFFPSALLLLCLLLILFSDACLAAASDALSAWWNRVLPALLPFSVFLSLADSAGLFSLLEHVGSPISKLLRIPDALPPCAVFGLFSGYPNGARLAAMRNIPAYAALCSFCSPVFLLGVVAHGLYGSKTVFLPLFLAHIGSGLLIALPCLLFGETTKLPCKDVRMQPPARHGFFPQLQYSMTVMASIGGCMVLFSIGIALIEQMHLLTPLAWLLRPVSASEEHLLALLHGIFEFAGGCVSIAAIDLPLRIRLAMTAFTVSFGGLCVLMQTAMFLDRADLQRYGKRKLIQGVLAAILAYLLVPKFCSSEIAVFFSADESLLYTENALSMGSILFSSSAVLLAFYLFALALGKLFRRTKPEHG